MYIHDIIKIKYSTEGYLPDYPPHLLSDEEMFDAFINNEISYFFMNYKLESENLEEEYETLINAIRYHIGKFQDDGVPIPDWVYSYMLGITICNSSNQEDKHYLLTGIDADNIADDIDGESQENCYKLSKLYVSKLSKTEREAEIRVPKPELLDDEEDPVEDETSDDKTSEEDDTILVTIETRPPTMFGEPHVIKQIRLSGVA